MNFSFAQILFNERTMKRACVLFSILYLGTTLLGQNNFLNQAIDLALKNNLTLREDALYIEKSQLKLAELRRQHLPNLTFQSRYSSAFGGRFFEVPGGDLLNPIFNNLNVINRQLDPSGNPDQIYPSIDNEKIPFLRETEHETYLQMMLPIFNPVLNQGKQLQQQQIKIAEQKLTLAQQELSGEVKTVYFNYLKINGLKAVLQNADNLVRENLKTAKSLYKFNQVTLDAVYLAEVEVKKVAKESAILRQKEQTTSAYFNSLLNRAIDTPIPQKNEMPIPLLNNLSLEESLQKASEQRLDFSRIEIAQSMADQQVKAQKAAYQPHLNFVGQYGVQGTDYRSDDTGDYAVGSLVLSWNIFAGTKKPKVEQAKLDQAILANQKENLRNKIRLEVVTAFYALEAMKENRLLAIAQKESAAKAYQLIQKKFEQGQANLAEITNARTQLTNAEQEIILVEYDYWIKVFALEKAIGD